MKKQIVRLEALLEEGTDEYMKEVNSIEDAVNDKIKDLEMEFSETFSKMKKDMEKQRRLSTMKMKDTVLDVRKQMYDAEERILRFARQVQERPVQKK
eukprot:3187290-Karenia_brevis.AAC.1